MSRRKIIQVSLMLCVVGFGGCGALTSKDGVGPPQPAQVTTSPAGTPGATPTPRPRVSYPKTLGEDESCTIIRDSQRPSGKRGEITAVAPLNVMPGSRVAVEAVGFAPGASVDVRVGRPASGVVTDALAVGEASGVGAVRIEFQVPENIDRTVVLRRPNGSLVGCLVISLGSLIPDAAGVVYQDIALVEYRDP